MSIEEICKKYGIENYTINDDNSIDVDGYVDLQAYHIKELPLTFNKVTGTFHCSDNNLTSLEGSPKSVGGDFYCYNNSLTSLKGSPKSVGGIFNCEYNNLTSLEGSPESIGDNFNCGYNNLTDLKGSPDSVGGIFNCDDNKLTDLKGSPKWVGGYFYCRNNPIESIFNNVDIDFIRAFKTFKVLNNGVIDLKRLRYVMEMFDLPIYIEEIKKYYTIK